MAVMTRTLRLAASAYHRRRQSGSRRCLGAAHRHDHR